MTDLTWKNVTEQDFERMLLALRDIHMQATRKDRATDERPYLITDLEIIERKAREAQVKL